MIQLELGGFIDTNDCLIKYLLILCLIFISPSVLMIILFRSPQLSSYLPEELPLILSLLQYSFNLFSPITLSFLPTKSPQLLYYPPEFLLISLLIPLILSLLQHLRCFSIWVLHRVRQSLLQRYRRKLAGSSHSTSLVWMHVRLMELKMIKMQFISWNTIRWIIFSKNNEGKNDGKDWFRKVCFFAFVGI